jgi:NADP-dependent 3-hydroxy acid dehydrogenase YdfG
MELIIQNDGLYQLVPLTKEMTEHILLLVKVNCMDLCEILRINLTSYVDSLNLHVMNDGSGNFYGCICK